ncbi:MAG: phosphatidate cytidylyltransferase [Betaproteobacteria bacterium]
MSPLAQRVATALVLLALFFAAVFLLPSIAFALIVAVVLALGAHEWARLIGFAAAASAAYAALVAALALALLFAPAAAFGPGWPPRLLMAVCGAATIFWVLLAPLWVIGRWPTRTRWLMAMIGIVTLPALWMALVELHARSPWMLLGAMALVWVADTAAFFAGRRFGRHKLAPQVSPGKTWEGVAGACAAVAAYAALCAYLGAGDTQAGAVLAWVGVALVLTALSIVGDLYESWLKRNAGVKDSGALLPGHGGVLDRIDALLAAMPPAALAIGAWLR